MKCLRKTKKMLTSRLRSSPGSRSERADRPLDPSSETRTLKSPQGARSEISPPSSGSSTKCKLNLQEVLRERRGNGERKGEETSAENSGYGERVKDRNSIRSSNNGSGEKDIDTDDLDVDNIHTKHDHADDNPDCCGCVTARYRLLLAW